MNKDSFADRLKAAMDIRNMKAVDLAEKSGLSKSRISQYINGVYEAKQDGVYLLAKALDVNEAWLMGYDVPMDRVEKIPEKFTQAQLQLLTLFDRLDYGDQMQVIGTVQGLLMQDKYKKESQSYKNA